ncbi:unnamed protein product [Durusdinium trenchii]|uniref:TIR domain-containing protein n=1 Tax=Durusdinium trenchii TaxID=1381693 RepID=A0ABP0KNK7_9DINO
MASFANSRAYFEARAHEYGVPAELLTHLQNQGINALGQEFDEGRFDTWLRSVNAGAEVIVIASLKAAVEAPTSESVTPKAIPFAERSARLAHIRAKLPGLHLEGPGEPSQTLLDEVCSDVSKPLRSIELPDGLPGLPPSDVIRVAQVLDKGRCPYLPTLLRRFIAKWTREAANLAKEEEELKRKMLEETGFADLGAVDELQLGADLTGEVPKTRLLPPKFVPALLTPDSLAMRAKLDRDRVLQVPGSGDSEIDQEVYDKTIDEVRCGWLRGPLAPEQVPAEAPISKRFGLRQKHKIRLIDNFSESGVNDCVTVCESPVLHTVDVAGALVTCWLEECAHSQRDATLFARAFDLSNAYRQVALSKEGRKFSHISVFNPALGHREIFQCLVLPFGAVRSVHSFLRIARALWRLGVVGCKLMWSSFYDDFITFAPKGLERSSELAAEALFKLTGWLFAESGRKCVPFSQTCEALGVIFDLSCSGSGLCRISNTEAHVAEISAALLDVISKGCMTRAEAQKLRGRMQFAEAQLFGRTAKRCVKVLSSFTEHRRSLLSAKEKAFLELFRAYLVSSRPRELRALNSSPTLIFTDACYESDARSWKCGLGGVMISSNRAQVEFFSLELSDEQREVLGERSKKQIIFETETLAAVLAFSFWSAVIGNSRTVIFVDNEGSKFALLKGVSDNLCVDCLAMIFAEQEARLSLSPWLSRVPSHSNIADPPSRGDLEPLKFLKGVNASTRASLMLEVVLGRYLEMGE